MSSCASRLHRRGRAPALAAASAAQGSVAVPGGPPDLDERVREALPERLTLPRAAEVPAALGRVLQDTFKRDAGEPTLPLAVLFVVVAFLLVQGRIDRQDPRLASAPVEAEPELDVHGCSAPPARGQEA